MCDDVRRSWQSARYLALARWHPDLTNLSLCGYLKQIKEFRCGPIRLSSGIRVAFPIIGRMERSGTERRYATDFNFPPSPTPAIPPPAPPPSLCTSSLTPLSPFTPH